MGEYRAYPEYKDSDVEWLGDIPDHWKISSLRWHISIASGEGLSNTAFDKSKNEDNCFRVIGGNGTLGFSPHINTASKAFAIGRVGALCGNVHFVSEDCWITDNALKLSSWKGFDDGYFTNLLEAAKLNEYASTTAQPLITGEQVKSLKVVFPSVEEQQKIANFLDYETARIDTLIEKQQQLIALLKEKRQAVISHAVTKGLNPDAPMRDSGVEWLGEVPEHWGIKRFKNIFKINKRIAGELGHDILSITQKGIRIKDIESGEGQLSMDYSKYQLVYKGDFAMNHMDLLTGFVDISKYDGVTSPDYRVFSLEEINSIPEYYLAFLQMGYINRLFFPFGQGAAHIGRWRLPTEAFNDFLAPHPPKEEQKDIAEYVSKRIARMTTLEDKASSTISLMQERRTALISAAVTGKFDVRDWQPPESSNANSEQGVA